MINPPELVCDNETFSVLSGECENVIDTKQRLPDFCFRRAFDRYFVIEHAYIYKKEFGDFLHDISSILEDRSVNYMTIDPHPVDYYYRNYSFFGLASFRPSTLAERYVPVMSRGGHVDSFLSRGGDVGVLWGSSQKWGILCDRVSWEIAVIAVSGDVDVPAVSGFRCMNTLALSGYIRSQYSTNPSVAETFMQTFSDNYRL